MFNRNITIVQVMFFVSVGWHITRMIFGRGKGFFLGEPSVSLQIEAVRRYLKFKTKKEASEITSKQIFDDMNEDLAHYYIRYITIQGIEEGLKVYREEKEEKENAKQKERLELQEKHEEREKRNLNSNFFEDLKEKHKIKKFNKRKKGISHKEYLEKLQKDKEYWEKVDSEDKKKS